MPDPVWRCVVSNFTSTTGFYGPEEFFNHVSPHVDSPVPSSYSIFHVHVRKSNFMLLKLTNLYRSKEKREKLIETVYFLHQLYISDRNVKAKEMNTAHFYWSRCH